MAYMALNRRTKDSEINVEWDKHAHGLSNTPIDVWFGSSNELYLSLTVAEAEELAHALLNALREDAIAG